MKIFSTSHPDVKIIEPLLFEDERGFFYESYNRRNFYEAVGIDIEFVQDNHSKSIKNCLRGLHLQVKNPQAKLVRAIKGEIFDVAVDVRPNSPYFGTWCSVTLDAVKKQMLWIPAGFAHGFLTLSSTAEVAYKASDYYSPSSEISLLWNDPDLSISWPLKIPPLLSSKDAKGISLKRFINNKLTTL